MAHDWIFWGGVLGQMSSSIMWGKELRGMGGRGVINTESAEVERDIQEARCPWQKRGHNQGIKRT